LDATTLAAIREAEDDVAKLRQAIKPLVAYYGGEGAPTEREKLGIQAL
jgi:hypothetical protein